MTRVLPRRRLTPLLLWIAVAAPVIARAADAPVSFKRDVAPILIKQCQGCHNAEKNKAQFRVDTFERLMRPGKSKDAPIKAGHPKDSPLYRLITTADEDERMPQKADPCPPRKSRRSAAGSRRARNSTAATPPCR